MKLLIKLITSLLVLLVPMSAGFAATTEIPGTMQRPPFKGTILFVPMDDRPVCKDYNVDTLKAAGWDIKLPPAELISSSDRGGSPDKLFEWLEAEAPGALAIVASADALIYGGLVDSRTHHFEDSVLKSRAERLISLKTTCGNPDVYVFVTIMRSPRASSAPVEPAYYGQWGPKFFKMGALEDKLDLNKKLSGKEAKELEALQKEIPHDFQRDNSYRRMLNIHTTELLLHGVESGDFNYLLIGRDDTAPFSQAHNEARHMDTLVRELPKERIRFFSGADQLGMILLTRATHRLSCELPLVYTFYGEGKGKETIPSYEDEAVEISAKQHIYAAGAFPTDNMAKADAIMAVNTPYDGKTLESSNVLNNGVLDKRKKRFLDKVDKALTLNKPLIVADIAYGNGADNALVQEMFKRGVADRVAAYGGWNTAGNALGFALGQGLMSTAMSEEDKNKQLEIRYLDDWAYQANARGKLYRELIWPNKLPNQQFKPELLARVEAALRSDMQTVAGPVMGEATVAKYNFTLPWKRMFEVEVTTK